jgi:peroxiredoxin
MLPSITFAQALLWLGNGCVLVVFALAGATKFRDLNRAREGLTDFGVPGHWAQSLVIALALTEIAIAILLAYPPMQAAGLLGALVLLAVFTLALIGQLLRGKRPTCACFGALTQSPISWKSVGRNGLLMALAIGLVVLPTTNSLPQQTISLSSLVAMAWAALSAIWLLHLTRQNGRLLLRIEQLEQTPTDAPSTQPQPLQVGAALPLLRLNDAHGRPFDLHKFRGMQVLFLFLDANCAHCRPLIARLHDAPLVNLYAASMAIIVVSESDDLRHQLPAEATLLVDPDWSTMTLFGLRGTPAAAWIDVDGALAKTVVHGASAVRAEIDAVIAPSNHVREEVHHELATV